MEVAHIVFILGVISMFVPSPIVNSFSVKAYVGDEKTLLAFNFQSAEKAKHLAGFTSFASRPDKCPATICQTIFFGLKNPSKHQSGPASARRLTPP